MTTYGPYRRLRHHGGIATGAFMLLVTALLLMAGPATALDFYGGSHTVSDGTYDSIGIWDGADVTLDQAPGETLETEDADIYSSSATLLDGTILRSVYLGFYDNVSPSNFEMYGGTLGAAPDPVTGYPEGAYIWINDGNHVGIHGGTLWMEKINVYSVSSLEITGGTFRVEDILHEHGGSAFRMSGGDITGRLRLDGNAHISGGSFNAGWTVAFEPDGTPYDKVVGGLFFESDSNGSAHITGGDFTGLQFTDESGNTRYRPFVNGSDQDRNGTLHISGGQFAPGQMMHGLYNTTTWIHGTDFQVRAVTLPPEGLPSFPNYQPGSIKRGAALISCTLADGSYFETEWRFWQTPGSEADYLADPDRFFNWDTIFECEWRYDERWDLELGDAFDGWGWYPILDANGWGTPSFATHGSLILTTAPAPEVPEPATTALLAAAALGGLIGRRRR